MNGAERAGVLLGKAAVGRRLIEEWLPIAALGNGSGGSRWQATPCRRATSFMSGGRSVHSWPAVQRSWRQCCQPGIGVLSCG